MFHYRRVRSTTRGYIFSLFVSPPGEVERGGTLLTGPWSLVPGPHPHLCPRPEQSTLHLLNQDQDRVPPAPPLPHTHCPVPWPKPLCPHPPTHPTPLSAWAENATDMIRRGGGGVVRLLHFQAGGLFCLRKFLKIWQDAILCFSAWMNYN